MNNNMKKDFFWNILGVSINSFNSLFLLVIINNLNTKNDAGIFTYAYSLICLFFVIAVYFNRTYQISNSKKYSDMEFIICRLVTCVITMTTVALFLILNDYNMNKIIIIGLICIFRILEAISDTIYGILQKNDKLYLSGILMVIKGIIGIILFTIIDFFTKSVILSLIGLIIVSIVMIVFVEKSKIKDDLTKKVDKRNIKKILFDSTPVFIFSFLSIYVSNISKYMLDYFDSAEMQNIYGIILMPSTMVGLCSSYIVNPFINKLNNFFEQKKFREFNSIVTKLVLSLMILGFLFIIMMIAFGIAIMNILYSININDYKLLMVIILVGAILFTIANIFSSVLVIMKRNKQQVFIYFIVSIIGTVITQFLIKHSGISGASYSYVISMLILFCQYLILYIVSYKEVKKDEEKNRC